MNEIHLIKDYRGALYSSILNMYQLYSLDVGLFKRRLEEKGWTVQLHEFPDIDFSLDWKGKLVFYQSSEDIGLEYKSYIEDVMLGLELAGAILLPGYPFLRAHMNKSFMEILRKVSAAPEAKTLDCRIFGVYEDFQRRADSIRFPAVFKPAAGAVSRGVALIKNRDEALVQLKKKMRSPICLGTFKELYKRLLRKGHVPYSLRRQKIILQEFVPNLDGDYKVLIYGHRAYIVRRGVRDNDFRASGSGKLSWPKEIPDGLLEVAWKILKGFDVPHISLDIAFDGRQFHMIEVQFLQFGTATLDRSKHYWVRENEQWRLVEGTSELEETIAEGLTLHAKEHDYWQGEE